MQGSTLTKASPGWSRLASEPAAHLLLGSITALVSPGTVAQVERHMRFQTLYEGRWIFAVVFGLGAIGLGLHWWWLIILASLLLIFCINFFRDPERTAPIDPLAVISAADGTVADVVEIDESEVLHRRMKRVGIFLSVFDVHTNRAPIDGKVTYLQHHPGLFLDARHAEATTKNEAMTWAFQGNDVTLVVRQITGAIARRIVPWSKVGDQIRRGERFGMIRFGSRTEVYVPLESEITVKIGDKVKGGLSVIARLPK
jgi:phosphatidylserine decarboxylase